MKPSALGLIATAVGVAALAPAFAHHSFAAQFDGSNTVTLDGTVSTRLQKRRAEDCAEDVSGVKHVQNNLRVQEQSTWDRTERSEAAGKSAT